MHSYHLRRIGDGASSKVFAVIDAATGSETGYVVKAAWFANAASRRTLGLPIDNELRALERVQGHANVVVLVEAHPHALLIPQDNTAGACEVHYDSTACIAVLQHCRGGDLLELLRQSAPSLCAWQRCSIVCQLVCGVAHCHARGVVLRDIKPENVFLENSGGRAHVRLGDLDLAHIGGEGADFLANPGASGGLTQRVGTLSYVDPAVFHLNGGTYNGAAADVWSLGVVFHLVLIGQWPHFEGYSDTRRHPAPPPPPTAAVAVTAPQQWPQHSLSCPMQRASAWDLIEQMLRPDPATRITMLEVVQHPFICGFARA